MSKITIGKDGIPRCPDCGGYLTIARKEVNLHTNIRVYHCLGCGKTFPIPMDKQIKDELEKYLGE